MADLGAPGGWGADGCFPLELRLILSSFPGNPHRIADMVHRNYHNGLKTTLLLGGMWALLLAIGALVASGTGRMVWIVVFAGIGLVQTAYSYWNSATIALRSMGAYRVTEAQYPQLYAIVRELSARAQQPMP